MDDSLPSSTRSVNSSGPSYKSRNPSWSKTGTVMEYDKEVSLSSEVYPMSVYLETAEIGSWKYVSKELGDIKLLSEPESSDLLIKTAIKGSNGGLPATYRIKSVTAADLSVFSVVPCSLESMVARMILETDGVLYLPQVYKGKLGGGKPEIYSSDLKIGIIKMTASIHETGHLRDTLLFLKSNYSQTDIKSISQTKLQPEDKEETGFSKPRLTFMEGLPHWVLYMPWILYSRKIRYVLELILFLSSIFSVVWAMWQLYRHVNVIHAVMEPLIANLRYYLSTFFELLDWIFAVFTLWWHTFLSPLNVLLGLMLKPMINILMQFKGMLYILYLPISQLARNMGLISAVKNTMSIFYSTLWILVRIIVKPVSFIWQSFLNSRIAVPSIDFRQSWVFHLVMNSIRAILRGLAALVGYTRKEQKIKKAMNTSTPVVSPITSPAIRKRRSEMPIMYSSPVTRETD